MTPPLTTPVAVSSWSLEQRMIEAARRAGPKLPAHMRAEFEQLLTPAALATTGGVFVVWGLSHACGVGLAVDVVLVAASALTMGWIAVQAAEQFALYATTAARARREADLELASAYLAKGICLIGINAFAALLTKRSVTLAARAQLMQRAERVGVVLGAKAHLPQVRLRIATALQFIEKRFPSGAPLAPVNPKRGASAPFENWLRQALIGAGEGHRKLPDLKGIDFSRDVKVTTLKRGTELVTRSEKVPALGEEARFTADQLGDYYTTRGTPAERTGIAASERGHVVVRLKHDVEVLESTASAIGDTFSSSKPTFDRRAARDSRALATGGGIQYLVPDAKNVLEVVTVQFKAGNGQRVTWSPLPE